MRRIGIIAAFPGELKPLVRGWSSLPLRGSHKGSRAWEGRIGEVECVAVTAGMGQSAAARACGFAAERGELSALVSVGWAGALSREMRPVSSYRVDEVVDVNTGERFQGSLRVAPGAPVRLVTVNRVINSAEKRRLAESYQAHLVDMEAATVARLAAAWGIPFCCLKAVSDAADAELPDFSRFTDAHGGLRMPALLAYIALRPGYWAGLARMSKNTKAGAAALAAALTQLLGDGRHAERDGL